MPFRPEKWHRPGSAPLDAPPAVPCFLALAAAAAARFLCFLASAFEGFRVFGCIFVHCKRRVAGWCGHTARAQGSETAPNERRSHDAITSARDLHEDSRTWSGRRLASAGNGHLPVARKRLLEREAPLQPPSGPNAFVRHWGTHTGQPQQFCRPRSKDVLAAIAQIGVRVELPIRPTPPLPPQGPPGLAKLHAAPQHTKAEGQRACGRVRPERGQPRHPQLVSPGCSAIFLSRPSEREIRSEAALIQPEWCPKPGPTGLRRNGQPEALF